MGTLVRAASVHFLIQREDHGAALAALHALADERPRDLSDAAGVLRSDTLAEALGAAGYDADFDAHGDLTRLAYRPDKAPIDAGDAWLENALDALAPWVLSGAVIASSDADPGYTRHEFDRGTRARWRREHGIWLEITAPERPCAGGEITSFRVRVRCQRTPDAPIVVMPGRDDQCAPKTRRHTMKPNTARTVRVSVDPSADGPLSLEVRWSCGAHDGVAPVSIPITAQPQRKIIATSSSADDRHPLEALQRTDEQAALTLLQRYAHRHRAMRDAAFLDAVSAARDLESALAAAGLQVVRDSSGVMLGARLTHDALTRPERYVFGAWWSLAPYIRNEPRLMLVYEDDPERWVFATFTESRRPQRALVSRAEWAALRGE
jgi:hypothetical protein